MGSDNMVFDRYKEISEAVNADSALLEEFQGLIDQGKNYFMAMMMGQEIDKDALNSKFDEVNIVLESKLGKSFKEWDIDTVIKELMRGMMSQG